MQEKVYRIKPAVNIEETGYAYPAVESFDNYDFKSPESIHNLRTNVIPKFTPDFRFKLAEGAKITDMLSEAISNSAGLLISGKLLDIFQKHTISPYIVYPVYIHNDDRIFEYFWIHYIWEEWHDFVCWESSTFKLFERGQFIDLEINSYDEYAKEVSKSKFFRVAPDNIKILPIDFDMYCHPFIGEIKISKQLAMSILNSKATGVEIIPKPLALLT